MNIHYYFKYGIKNKIFKKFLINDKHYKILISIYFGKWKCEDYRNHENDDPQIKTFFSIDGSNDIHYFWIFDEKKIYLYRANENKIINGCDDLIDDSGSYPKSVKCSLVKTYEKIGSPQVFSSTNTNQKYNRKTIVKLKGPEEEIANSLITKKVININWNNFLNYLSPVEFETLCFLIFNMGGSHCSSFRGGTLENYDLRVKNNGQYKDFESVFWIQVKKKGNNKKPEEGMYLFQPGETNIEERILGNKWILNTIESNSKIKKWLRGLFEEYDNIFSLNWSVT